MKRFFLVLFLLLLLFTVTVSSHPGRTDSNGGHWDRQEGTYHYHNDGTPQNSSSSKADNSDKDDVEARIAAKEKIVYANSTDENKEPIETKADLETEKEKTKDVTSRTIIIIVVIIVLGVLLFFIAKWAIDNYSADEFFGHLFIITIIIAGVIMLQSCGTSESYESHIENCDGKCSHIEEYTNNFYEDTVSYYEENSYKNHVENCDGTCDHIENEIDHRVCDLGELCYLENVFDYYDVIEAIENAYIQGYGDCYYGNAQEYSIKDRKSVV